MTGMKEGAGEDPFADDSDDTDDSTAEQATDPTTTPMSESEPPTDTDETSTDDPEIPWVLARSSTKEDRDTVKQFFLREETEQGERVLRSEVEDILGKEVQKLDLREAAYLVAQRHPDEVAEELEKWGYEYL